MKNKESYKFKLRDFIPFSTEYIVRNSGDTSRQYQSRVMIWQFYNNICLPTIALGGTVAGVVGLAKLLIK